MCVQLCKETKHFHFLPSKKILFSWHNNGVTANLDLTPDVNLEHYTHVTYCTVQVITLIGPISPTHYTTRDIGGQFFKGNSGCVKVIFWPIKLLLVRF